MMLYKTLGRMKRGYNIAQQGYKISLREWKKLIFHK